LSVANLLPAAVYFLCFATGAACALLLFRSFLRTRARLLMWSALCFLFLAANNLAVIFDLLILPDQNYSILRVALSLTAVSLLLFGCIWGADDE
jgi:hypothetical protein